MYDDVYTERIIPTICGDFYCIYLQAWSMNIQAILWLLVVLATSVATVHVIDVDGNFGSDDPSCYSSNSEPCKTLDYALINGLTSSTTIMIYKGHYHLSLVNTSFHSMADIAIIGMGYNVTTVECDFGVGISFWSIDKLVLAKLTLFGGGKIMNVTSVKSTTGVLRVALYLSDCTDVTIDGLKITNSTGTGMAMFNVTGKVKITHSLFLFNRPLDREKLPGGGGAFITFTNQTNSWYNVLNCSFISNTATSGDTRLPMPLPLTNVHQFGFGGGLHFTAREFSQDNNITIQDSKFLYNSAVWGGGLSIVFLDYSKRNRVTITNVHYEGNYLPYKGSENSTATGGGAIRIAILPNLPFGYTTSISITGCRFVGNSALFGGGISFELKKETGPSTTISIYIANCTWNNNVGRLGSALDVYSHTYPLGEPADFTIDTCSFISNTNHYTDSFVKPVGLGTVYSWSVPISLKNKNIFIGNYGSALVGVSTQYHFQSGAVVVFENNTAENGGAITMLENSHIILNDNIELNFTHNIAAGKGGAMHVINTGQRNFVGSHHCFVVYKDLSVSPYEWKDINIKISFAHNSAKFGNSIFATSLLPCVWKKVEGLKEINLDDAKQVFYWNETFYYEGLSDVNELEQEISSEAVYVPNFNKTESFPPGKLYNFKFNVENDRMEKAEAVYFVTTNNSNVAVVDDAESYSDGYVRLYGQPRSVFDVALTTTSNLPLSIQVSVKLDDCPPGFYPHGSSPNETVCKCSVNIPGEDYIGIVSCDSTKLVAYLKEAHYAGYRIIRNKKVLLTSSCLQGYCKDQGSYIQLPSNSSNNALDDLICKPQHRTGTLCGKCAEGSYIYANSPNFKCGPCTVPVVKEVLYYIFAKCLALSIFILIIGIFNISLVNGPLNSFILFSQLLPYMDIYAGDRISIPNQTVVTAYRFLYGMWNLNFFETIAVPYICLHKTQSALFINILDLIPVVLASFVTGFIYLIGLCNCCNSCRHKSSNFAKKCLIIVVGKVMVFINTITSHEYVKCIVPPIKRCIYNGESDSVVRSDQSGSSINTTNNSASLHNNEPGRNTVLLRIGPLLTIVILCYARVTAFGFVSLSYSKLYGRSKDDSSDTLTVFRYDGTLKYSEHLYFIIFGSLAVCLVLLLPFILIIFPCCRTYKCCHKCPYKCLYPLCWCMCAKPKLDSCEENQNGDNKDAFKYTCICSKQKKCNHDSFYINKIFDAVQQCYKNNNCVVARAAALYLLYRFIILGFYAFTPSIQLQYLQQSSCFVLMLIVHSMFQPYKDNIYNIVDTFMFGNLALIPAISYYRLYNDAQDLSATNMSFVIQTILIYLPFLYFVTLCCLKPYRIYANSQAEQKSCDQTDDSETDDEGTQLLQH